MLWGLQDSVNPLTDSPFDRLARTIGEAQRQAYTEFMAELVARHGQRQRIPVAWLYGVREIRPGHLVQVSGRI
ncbi:MAG: hypothetical protein AB1609_04050 [Bacillota bacterium]